LGGRRRKSTSTLLNLLKSFKIKCLNPSVRHEKLKKLTEKPVIPVSKRNRKISVYLIYEENRLLFTTNRYTTGWKNSIWRQHLQTVYGRVNSSAISPQNCPWVRIWTIRKVRTGKYNISLNFVAGYLAPKGLKSCFCGSVYARTSTATTSSKTCSSLAGRSNLRFAGPVASADSEMTERIALIFLSSTRHSFSIAHSCGFEIIIKFGFKTSVILFGAAMRRKFGERNVNVVTLSSLEE